MFVQIEQSIPTVNIDSIHASGLQVFLIIFGNFKEIKCHQTVLTLGGSKKGKHQMLDFPR